MLGTGGVVHTVAGDVSRVADAQAMVAGHVALHGRLDFVFCNAGIPGVAPIEDLDEEPGTASSG